MNLKRFVVGFILLGGGAGALVGAEKPVHWSYRPLVEPAVPAASSGWIRNPIDAFVLAKLTEKGLKPSPEADRRTLIRRVSFDLTGLPPDPDEVDRFAADPSPDAYEKLVDRLLSSKRYGECWARHWLDIVHYADTHGYDKDKLRPNAWPYRDYVIRAFNEDRPYARFIREQLAGDVLFPGTPDGIAALGFIAAGPFDFVGQVELADGTLDKSITRNLDRDDMVTTTMNAFVSTTVQCARCHDHKFDPVTQEDYYSLQAVFAGVDRADRPYDSDPSVAKRRRDLQRQIEGLAAQRQAVEKQIDPAAEAVLAAIDERISRIASTPATAEERPEFGYHSELSAVQENAKWVQVDLGKATAIDSVCVVAAYDTFGNIGAGFGFPLRFKIEASNDPRFAAGVETIADKTSDDVPNPACAMQIFTAGSAVARYIRITATRLALRQDAYIFALGEMAVLTPDGVNAALNRPVTSLDSIEAAPRWSRKNLVDGYYHGVKPGSNGLPEEAKLERERRETLERSLPANVRGQLLKIDEELQRSRQSLASLPAQSLVFAAASEFASAGSFVPTHGKCRPIHILKRGSEKDPGKEVGPGTLSCLSGLRSRFAIPADAPEAERRAALAEWIADGNNPLTWRSIVNRVWQYHFGRGIVETPSDFGKMGALPTHPELLDWLAVRFRDSGGSMKSLHRLILTSSTYRQASRDDAGAAKIDASNQFLWRMNRNRLEAEQVRDSVLAVAGKLDLTMGGPGYRDFGFTDDHSPRYDYQGFDPDEPSSLRRSVYRFIVRSAPDPFMEALDCADASQCVPRRDETLTALQALALLNDRLMIRMAGHFAQRVQTVCSEPSAQVDAAVRLALGRAATAEEKRVLARVVERDGLPSACRLILNLTEFSYVD